MSYFIQAPAPQIVTQVPFSTIPAANVPTEEAAEPGYIQAQGHVGGWIRVLKFLCITTIIFCAFTFLFAGLTIYKNGETVESGLDFESRLFLMTPMVIPLAFMFFGDVTQFATMRYNVTTNLNGKLVNESNNGRKVTREVFSGLMYPSIITITLFICYVASFSIFFAYGTPRCVTESVNENKELYYIAHKGACHIYNYEPMKMILAGLILTQTVLLMFYFYKSMPVDRRKQAGSLAEEMGGKARKGVSAAPGAMVGAGRKAGAMADTGRRAIMKQAEKQRLKMQQRAQARAQQQRVANSQVAQDSTTAAKKRNAAQRIKSLASRQRAKIANSSVTAAKKGNAAQRFKTLANRYRQQRANSSQYQQKQKLGKQHSVKMPPSVRLTRR